MLDDQMVTVRSIVDGRRELDGEDDDCQENTPMLDAQKFDDARRELRNMSSVLAAFAGITCTFRQSIGPILEDSEKRGLFRNALEETFAIARARGVTLPDGLVDKRMDFADGLPAEMYSSMYHDLNAGKRLELPWLSGTVVDFGHDLGIDTPAHQSFVDALSSNVDGSPG